MGESLTTNSNASLFHYGWDPGNGVGEGLVAVNASGTYWAENSFDEPVFHKDEAVEGVLRPITPQTCASLKRGDYSYVDQTDR